MFAMKQNLLKIAAFLLALHAGAYSHESSSANYRIVPQGIDAGGGAAESANYQITASSIGGFIGAGHSAYYSSAAGYVAQLADRPPADLCNYDSWAALFFTLGQVGSEPTDDFDGDGQTNEQEFLTLTDPTNPTQRFELDIVSDGRGFDLVFAPFVQTLARTYRLRRGGSLENFDQPSSTLPSLRPS